MEILDKNKSKSKTSGIEGMGKVPPQAVELEQAVLGALMLEKDALSRVIDIINFEIFYKQGHQEIFKAITALFTNSDPIDLLTVIQQLRQMGKIDLVGGPQYIAELTSKVSSAANIEYHSRIIAQKFIQRELIRISGEISKDAYEETTDVFELLDRAEQNLFALSETNLRRNFSNMSELVMKTIQRLEDLKSKGEGVTGVPSGFKALDEMTAGWQKSDLVIIAARPAMGKTAFVLSLTRNAALQHKKGVAFFTLEMTATQLVQRLMFSEAEIDAQKGRSGNLTPDEWNTLNTRISELRTAPIYIDDSPSLSMMDLRAKCRRLKAEKGIDMVIIDYLQLMKGDTTKGGSREQEIAFISRGLKELAKELDVPILALSQLSRAVETRGGSDKRPQLSDLRESGSIEQDADMVMFLYRPEYYGFATLEDGTPTQGLAQVIIGKQRNGPVGDVTLEFVNAFAKFRDLQVSGYSNPNQNTNNSTTIPIVPSNKFNTPTSGTGSITLPSKMNTADDIDDTPF